MKGNDWSGLYNRLQDIYSISEGAKEGGGKKAMHFLAQQVVEQSSLGVGERDQLFGRLAKGAIAEVSPLRMMQDLQEYNLLPQLEKNTSWLTSQTGQRFLQEQVAPSGISTITRDLPKSVQWSRLKTHADAVSARMTQAGTKIEAPLRLGKNPSISSYMRQFQEQMADALGIDRNLVTTSHVSSVESKFYIKGLGEQVSRVHKFSVKATGSSLPAQGFDFFELSEGGFMAGSSHHAARGGWKEGQSIFTTPGMFVTDPFEQGRGKDKYWDAKVFGGPDAGAAKAGVNIRTSSMSKAYMDFQAHQFGLLQQRIAEIQSGAGGSAFKQKKIADLMESFKQEVGRFQHYVSEGSAISGLNDKFGAQRVNDAMLSKATFWQNMAGYSQGLSKIKHPMGSTVPFEILMRHNVQMTVSSGQAGKLKGFVSVGDTGFGPEELMRAHAEPYKALGTVIPYNAGKLQEEGLERFPRLFGNTLRANQGINTSQFQPRGVQAIMGFFNPEKLTERALTNNLMPDGTALFRDKAFASGMFDLGNMDVYRVKAHAPGDQPTILGKHLHALLEGGKISVGTKGQQINIPGLNQTGFNWNEALTPIGSQTLTDEALEHYFKDGVYLPRGELLGIEPGTGRDIRVNNSPHVTSRLMGIVPGQDGEYKLLVSRHTHAVQRNNRTVGQSVKITGEALVKEAQGQKFLAQQIDDVSAMRMMAATGVQMHNLSSRDVEGWMPIQTMDDPFIMTKHQAGALRLNAHRMQQYYQQIGAAKEASSAARRDGLENMAARIVNMSDDELLRALEGPEMEKLVTTQKAQAKMRAVLARGNKLSLEQKMVLMTDLLYSNMPEPEKQAAIANVFAPHTEWGKQQASKKMREKMDRTLMAWSTPSDKAMQWREGKNALQELNQALTDESFKAGVGGRVIASNQGMETLATFGMLNSSEMMGAGSRGTLEPRFFDIMQANKRMHPVSRALSGRMTDFTPQIQKLGNALTGNIPLGTPLTPYSQDVSKSIGRSDMLLDLMSVSPDEAAINQRIRELAPDKGYQFRSRLYIPGGDDVMQMGRMVTGGGLERSREMRSVYESYLKSWDFIKAKSTEDQIDLLARSTIQFQDELSNTLQTAVTGVPGGGSHGMLRGPVSGSSYLEVAPWDARMQDVVDHAHDRHTLDDLKVREQKFIENYKAQVVAGGESPGMQKFVSRKALDDMFDDLVGHYKDRPGMVDQVNAQRQRILQGGSALMPTWRHPGIGPESITPARIWLDQWSPDSETKHKIRVGEEYMRVRELTIDKKEVPGMKGELLQTSLLQKYKGDHDGDFINLAAIAEHDAEKALNDVFKSSKHSAHHHSARYHAMKHLADESMKYHSSQSVSSIAGHLKTPLGEAAALAGPKQLTPQISNTFSELRFMTGISDLNQARKADVLNFLEVAEQVSISTKHLVEGVEANQNVVAQVRAMRQKMLGGGAEMQQAVKDMFRLYTTTAEGKQADELKMAFSVLGTNKLADVTDQLSLKNIQADVVHAVDRFNKMGDMDEVLKLFRRTSKTKGVHIQDLMTRFNQFSSIIGDVHGHAAQYNMQAAEMAVRSVSQAGVSRSVLGGMNASTIERGMNNLGKLSSKGVVGVAAIASASLVAAGVTSMALGPTYTDKRGGGAYLTEDDLFPDEVQSKQAMLHSGAMPTPSGGVIRTPSYEARIHLPPGAYQPASLGGRLGGIMQSLGGGAAGRLHLDDSRMHLDAITLSRIRNDII